MTVDSARVPQRRTVRSWLAMVGTLTLVFGGLAAVLVVGSSAPAAAALVPIDQCNNVGNTNIDCHVVIVNTLTDDPATTGSVVTVNGGAPVASSDLITSVTQCNDSSNGGGAVVECSVDITNNIATNGPSAATAVSINQCNSNQSDGLGTAPNTCDPFPATTSGATIIQCNNSGNGGGLVNPSHCDASGTVSTTLPVTVNQCNDSANGGGTMVNCSATITTNVTDTGVTPPPDTDGPETPDTDGPETPDTDGPETPGSDGPETPGSDGPGTPGSDGPGTPGSDGPETPGSDGPETPGSDGPGTPGSDGPGTPGTGGPPFAEAPPAPPVVTETQLTG